MPFYHCLAPTGVFTQPMKQEIVTKLHASIATRRVRSPCSSKFSSRKSIPAMSFKTGNHRLLSDFTHASAPVGHRRSG